MVGDVRRWLKGDSVAFVDLAPNRENGCGALPGPMASSVGGLACTESLYCILSRSQPL